MLRLSELRLPFDHPPLALRSAVLEHLGIGDEALLELVVVKRSHDARRRDRIVATYIVDVAVADEGDLLSRHLGDRRISRAPEHRHQLPRIEPPASFLRPLVVGSGPCGLFAALALARLGLQPIVLERGKAVRERTVDTFGFWRRRQLDPESNVQFGEGGAGTFSDGKLYTQIRDRGGRGRMVLEELVAAGAPAEILTDSRPHIGTFKLVKVVEGLRATIESLGGEVRFRSRLDDLQLEGGAIRGVVLADGSTIAAERVVLALGHSARDTFEMLAARGVAMEPKPFSIGLRIEHPQALIDRCRWGRHAGHPALGAADYRLVHHCENGRSVYSFCMCPGGTVVAAASEPGGVVTNGMSQYDRAERNANSAIVVGISPEEDYPGGPLAGIELQRRLEAAAFALGGGDYRAPVQRVGDFLAGRASATLGAVTPSYAPGVLPCDLSSCLPDYVVAAIREALPAFDRKIPGFALPDAVLTGVETRTSSPLRLLRGADCQSVSVRGLYPAGEGAGYAGGILSAAVDGIEVGEALAIQLAGPTSAGISTP